MWLAEIIAVILLIIPFSVFADKNGFSVLYGFNRRKSSAHLCDGFRFSYEMIIALVIIAVIIRDLIRNKTCSSFLQKKAGPFFSPCAGCLL